MERGRASWGRGRPARLLRQCVNVERASARGPRKPALWKSEMNIEHVARIADLNARYADAIDADRLESWPDFFSDDGLYRITTAENVAQGLPLSLMYATSRAM